MTDNTLATITTRGLSGLTNLGNTCHLNAVIQCLLATNKFSSYLVDKRLGIKNHLKNVIAKKLLHSQCGPTSIIDPNSNFYDTALNNTLTQQLRYVLIYMWSENSEIKPVRLKQSIDKHIVYGEDNSNKRIQRDAHETFHKIIEKIHEETELESTITTTIDSNVLAMANTISTTLDALDKEILDEKRKEILIQLGKMKTDNIALYVAAEYYNFAKTTFCKVYSVIDEIFTSVDVTCIKCLTCNIPSYNFAQNYMINISIPEKYHSVPCVSLDTLLECHFAEEILSEKDGNLYNCAICGPQQPAVRFDMLYKPPNILTINLKKYKAIANTRLVKLPIKIQYSHTLDIAPFVINNSNENTKYQLYAAIRHDGAVGGGHYYAFCRNPINKLWFVYDDGEIYGVDRDEVLKSNCYVLFYEKI